MKNDVENETRDQIDRNAKQIRGYSSETEAHKVLAEKDDGRAEVDTDDKKEQ